jgi:hypothetical protein
MGRLIEDTFIHFSPSCLQSSANPNAEGSSDEDNFVHELKAYGEADRGYFLFISLLPASPVISQPKCRRLE